MNIWIKSIVVLAIFSLIAILGLHNWGSPNSTIPPIDESAIVATYGGQPVTAKEILVAFQESKTIKDIITAKSIASASPTDESSIQAIDALVIQLSRSIVFDKDLADQSRKKGFDQSEDFRLNQKEQFEKELYQKVLLEDVLKKIDITENDVRRFYDDNREIKYKLSKTDAFEVNGMYFDFSTKRSQEEALDLAQKALNSLKQGASFVEVRSTYSDIDPRYQNEIAYIGRSDAAPEIIRHLEACPDGGLTDIFEHKNRYFLFKRLSFSPAVYHDFEILKQTIYSDITNEQRTQATQLLLKKLRDNHICLVNSSLLSDSLNVDPSTIILSIPPAYELTLGEFKQMAEHRNFISERNQKRLLSVLTNQALCLVEAQARNWTEDDVSTQLAYWDTRWLANRFVTDAYSHVQITDTEISRHMVKNRNSDTYQTQPIYTIDSLFFPARIDPSLRGARIELAYQRAGGVAHQAYETIQEGSTFDEVADQYTREIASGITKQSQGKVPENRLLRRVSSVVKKLDVGGTSQPIRMMYTLQQRVGYELFHVRDCTPSRPMNDHEAFETAKRDLENKTLNTIKRNLSTSFDENFPVTLHQSVIRSISNYLNYLSTRVDLASDLSRFEEN